MKNVILTLVLAAGLPALTTLAQPSDEPSTPPAKEQASVTQKEKADANTEAPGRSSDFDGPRGDGYRNFHGRGMGGWRARGEGSRSCMAANCPYGRETSNCSQMGKAAGKRGTGYGRGGFHGGNRGFGMRHFARQTPGSSTMSDRPCLVMAETILRTLDVNHDGVLDASEIANAIDELKKLDMNKDGKLSRDEFGRQNRRGHRFANADVERMEKTNGPENSEDSFGAPRRHPSVETEAPAPRHFEGRRAEAFTGETPDFPEDAPAVSAVNPD